MYPFHLNVSTSVEQKYTNRPREKEREREDIRLSYELYTSSESNENGNLGFGFPASNRIDHVENERESLDTYAKVTGKSWKTWKLCTASMEKHGSICSIYFILLQSISRDPLVSLLFLLFFGANRAVSPTQSFASWVQLYAPQEYPAVNTSCPTSVLNESLDTKV